MSTRQDIRKLIREAVAKGWTDTTRNHPRNGHFFIRHPCGVEIPLPFSPGDYRSVRNCRADIARVEKGVDKRCRKLYVADN